MKTNDSNLLLSKYYHRFSFQWPTSITNKQIFSQFKNDLCYGLANISYCFLFRNLITPGQTVLVLVKIPREKSTLGNHWYYFCDKEVQCGKQSSTFRFALFQGKEKNLARRITFFTRPTDHSDNDQKFRLLPNVSGDKFFERHDQSFL